MIIQEKERTLATGKITVRTVDALPLPSKGKREHLWDDTLKGFGVMVTDMGVRSYIVQYRIGGRGSPTRRVTIGKAGSPWTPTTARKRAEEVLEQVRRKIDPFDDARAKLRQAEAEKREQAHARVVASRLAWKIVAADYITKRAKPKLRTWKEVESVIDRDLTPRLGSKPLTEINSADITELLEEIGERGESASRRAYNALRAVFSYAIDKHKRHFRTVDNPMLDVTRPTPPVERERALSDDELKLVWRASGRLGWPFGPIVRLLILTGQRLREVAWSPWDEYNLERREWVIPGSRTKNGVEMLVHLSDPALAMIKDLPRIKGKANLLFSTTGETPVSGFSRAKRRLDAIMLELLREDAVKAKFDQEAIDALAIADWRLHDLRRTMSTDLQRLKLSPAIIDRMQNHVAEGRRGTRKSYQLYDYAEEKADGFDKWGRFVTELVSPTPKSNVVPMERRA